MADLDLESQNNCALAALIAAREEQDTALKSMWTGSIRSSDTIDPTPTLHDSLRALEEMRAKEEASWAAHWTSVTAVTPAWENNTELEKVSEPEPESKTEPKPEPEPKPESKAEPKPEPEPKPESKAEPKPEPEPKINPEQESEPLPTIEITELS
jgi:outer membrane biosynthesis protein TonB